MACILCRNGSNKQRLLDSNNDAVDILKEHITKIDGTVDIEKFLDPDGFLCMQCLGKVESVLKLREDLREKEKELTVLLEQGISDTPRPGKRTSSQAGLETSYNKCSRHVHSPSSAVSYYWDDNCQYVFKLGY